MKRRIHIPFLFSGLLLFLIAVFYREEEISILFYLISSTLVSLGASKLGMYRYRRKQLSQRHRLYSADVRYAEKRAAVLLDVGNVCSWQYSVSAGILRFDTSDNTLLRSRKVYYTYEELCRNRHIKSAINRILEQNLSYFDDEIYIPGIKKWFIIRGRMMDMFDTTSQNQYVGVIIDNTERRETLKRLELLSSTDELTGLKNRRSFFHQLSKELNLFKREGVNFSVAMLDLDKFKKINDSYGHLAGDRVLKDFSNVIRKSVRPYDTVFRIGGEEFIIIFSNSNQAGAIKVLERVQEELLTTKTQYDGVTISYTFSCGVGEAVELGLYTENEFINIIDSRLYKAKESGRDLVISGG